MSSLVNVNKQNFEEEVLKSELPVLVDFWAPWCQPCLMMTPVLEEIAKEMEGKIKVIKVNTEEEENQELAIKYQIQSIPNMKLIKNGQVIGEFIGYRTKATLADELKKAIE